MAKKPKGSLLESLLRYEIILVLFTLIGVYYFLTFSPVRMPRHTITSATLELPSPPPDTAKKPDADSGKQITTIKPATPPPPAAEQKRHDTSVTKSAAVKKEVSTPPTPTAKKEMPSTVNPVATTPETRADQTIADNVQKAAETKQPSPPAIKPTGKQPVTSSLEKVEKSSPGTAVPTANSRKPAKTRQTTAKKQATIVKPVQTGRKTAAPGKKSYVIQVGIFIFPDTLKHYQQILKDHGYLSFVTTKRKAVPMHRVFLGPYQNLEKARKVIAAISKWGDEPFLSRRGEQFYINVGSFYYLKTANERIAVYRSRGFTPVVFHEPVSIPHHTLLVDGFAFNHYPRNALRSIKQLGIPDAFVRNRQP